MENLNYIFFEEFKSLDKLCVELYKEQNGITHYIEDMKAVSENVYKNIPNWNADLKNLVHVRHIRNNLAHAEGAFNEETCTQADIDWIKDFHNRILNQTDPISILYQNSKAKTQELKKLHTNNKAKKQNNIQTSEQIDIQISTLADAKISKQVNDQTNKENEKLKITQVIPIVITVILSILLIVFCLITVL